jgi:alkylation response protein AidB-like acyl-CoA dehydrogenase
MFISGGSYSGTYIVMAKTEDKKVSAFLIPADIKGLNYGKK